MAEIRGADSIRREDGPQTARKDTEIGQTEAS
jgi:hypothetical protein